MSTANVSVSDVCEDFDEEGKSVRNRIRKYSQTISIRDSLNLEPEEIQQQARRELELCHGRSLEHGEDHEESETSLAYRSTIGRNHFMTKELQGYIEGIRKRRNKRLYFLDQ